MSTISLSNAQTSTVTLKGSLVDAVTKKPVEFATVTLLTSTDTTLVKGSLSDTLGQFVFSNISVGSYYIISSSVEYKKTKQKIEVTNDIPIMDIGVISLDQEMKVLNEVIVSTQRLAFQPTAEGVTINMSNSLFKTSSNVVDVLKKSPSIQVKEDGSLLMRNSITPKVLINGKDVPMSSDEIKNYLNTLKPEEVESIEIITNPSAKYDAEFKGVINIRLKKDEQLGLKGNVSTTYQQYRYSSYYNTVGLSFKTKKVAYTARLNHSRTKYFQDSQFSQILNDGNTLNTNLYVPRTENNFDYQFGVDYYLSKKHIIGGLIKAYNNNKDEPTLNELSFSNLGKEMRNITSTSNVYTKNNNYSGILYYEGTINKGVLSITSSVAHYENSQNQDLKNLEETSATYLEGNFQNKTDIFSSQLDYSYPLKKGKIDFGAKIVNTNIDNDTKYQILSDGQWVIDKGNTNLFKYSEKILAGYVNYSNSFKKLSYIVGLRTENTNIVGNSITLNKISEQNYVYWLPSISLNLPINDENNLSLSYSKRLSRPSFSQLNPYVYINSPYLSYGGNQYLIPITNHAYSVSYSFKNFSLSTNFGINYNDIQDVPNYDPTTNKTIYIVQNLPSNTYRGVELGIPTKISKRWKMQHNFKYYVNDYKLSFNLPNFQGDVETKIKYTGINGDHTYTLNNGYNLSLSYNWETGGGKALFDLGDRWMLNVGLQKTFFKTLNAKININDIFYAYVFDAKTNRPEIINMTSSARFATRLFSLQLSYSFGQSVFNTKQVKNSSQEEENRAKR
jgi:outer membrane receptor protein involved in Fe transport